MTRAQWQNTSVEDFNQISLQDRYKYIDRWGLPPDVQKVRTVAEQQAWQHDWDIRNKNSC